MTVFVKWPQGPFESEFNPGSWGHRLLVLGNLGELPGVGGHCVYIVGEHDQDLLPPYP